MARVVRLNVDLLLYKDDRLWFRDNLRGAFRLLKDFLSLLFSLFFQSLLEQLLLQDKFGINGKLFLLTGTCFLLFDFSLR